MPLTDIIDLFANLELDVARSKHNPLLQKKRSRCGRVEFWALTIQRYCWMLFSSWMVSTSLWEIANNSILWLANSLEWATLMPTFTPKRVQRIAQEGFKISKLSTRRSPAIQQVECAVILPIDLYLSKLPVEAFHDDHFYMRLLPALPAPGHTPWFGKAKLGQNACTKVVGEVAEAAGLSSKKSNHSLRATTATTLFNKGVPEKLVQERTGHRSLTALRM